MPRSRSPEPSRRSDRDRTYHSERSRGRSRSPERTTTTHSSRRDRRRSASPSSSSEESDGHRKSRKRSSRHEDETREERKARKRAKKERKEAKKAAKEAKRKAKMGVIGQEYGKYGILTDADIFTKDAEFRSWLVEEKTLNPETLNQAKMKELFRSFAEDFNTVTLPHEKYYALEDYERRMRAVRMGEDVIPDIGYDPRADEEAARATHKKPSRKEQSDLILSKEQLVDLQRVQRERIEGAKMKRLGMETKEGHGVRYQ